VVESGQRGKEENSEGVGGEFVVLTVDLAGEEEDPDMEM
jgi:hypothetical protein